MGDGGLVMRVGEGRRSKEATKEPQGHPGPLAADGISGFWLV